MLVAELSGSINSILDSYKRTSIIRLSKIICDITKDISIERSKQKLEIIKSELLEIALNKEEIGNIYKHNINIRRILPFEIAEDLLHMISYNARDFPAHYEFERIHNKITKFYDEISNVYMFMSQLNLETTYNCYEQTPIRIEIPRNSVDNTFSKTLEINSAFSNIILDVCRLVNNEVKNPILVCSSTSDLVTVLAHDARVIYSTFIVFGKIYEAAVSFSEIIKAISILKKIKKDTKINEKEELTEEIDSKIDESVEQLKMENIIQGKIDEGTINEIKISLKKNCVKMVLAIVSGTKIGMANEDYLINMSENLVEFLPLISEIDLEIVDSCRKIKGLLRDEENIKYISHEK